MLITMESHKVKIISVSQVTHDVRCFRLDRPENYHFKPGQVTEIAIDLPGFREEKRPFSFTSKIDDEFLEFVIKIYNHNGVTQKLGELQAGDYLILHNVWGTINYKGPGVFIAGGAGITPFIAILRDLKSKNALTGNTLIFSNKTEQDIILKAEFEQILGSHFIITLTEENKPGYDYQVINEAYLNQKISDFDQYFYICGPDPMVESIKQALTNLGAQNIVIEEW